MKGRRQGFTLIELILVMAVLALVLAIGIPRYAGIREKQTREADLRTIELLEQAEETYFLLNREHTFDPDQEQTTETFTASMQELESLVDFQGFNIFEDPYWEEEDGSWVIRYAEGGEAEPDEEEAVSEWNPTSAYASGDEVTYDGKTYKADKDIGAGEKPPKTNPNWKKI